MRVINLLGGPGLGKSTTAAHLLYLLKTKGYDAELVPEHAKLLFYMEVSKLQWNNQLEILSNQYKWLHCLNDKIDYAIVDSPLINSAIYVDDPHINKLSLNLFNKFSNTNFLLSREDSYYSNNGRGQTLEEARLIDRKVELFLNRNNIPYYVEEVSRGGIGYSILKKIRASH